MAFERMLQWRNIDSGFSDRHEDVLSILEALCIGRAVYGIDVRRDGMVYAPIEHPPVISGKVKSADDGEALKVPSVQQTIPISSFTAPPVLASRVCRHSLPRFAMRFMPRRVSALANCHF